MARNKEEILPTKANAGIRMQAKRPRLLAGIQPKNNVCDIHFKNLPMKTIWKFELTPNRLQSVPVPCGGQILTVQTKSDNAPMMWVLVDPDMPPKDVHIGIYTTNTELPDDPGKYLGSFTLYEGSLEFHVFEVENLPDEIEKSGIH